MFIAMTVFMLHSQTQANIKSFCGSNKPSNTIQYKAVQHRPMGLESSSNQIRYVKYRLYSRHDENSEERKAELTSGLGRAGFAVHGPLDALATSKFGLCRHANLFLRFYYQQEQ
jgi:hypothetical protein